MDERVEDLALGRAGALREQTSVLEGCDGPSDQEGLNDRLGCSDAFPAEIGERLAAREEALDALDLERGAERDDLDLQRA